MKRKGLNSSGSHAWVIRPVGEKLHKGQSRDGESGISVSSAMLGSVYTGPTPAIVRWICNHGNSSHGNHHGAARSQRPNVKHWRTSVWTACHEWSLSKQMMISGKYLNGETSSVMSGEKLACVPLGSHKSRISTHDRHEIGRSLKKLVAVVRELCDLLLFSSCKLWTLNWLLRPAFFG